MTLGIQPPRPICRDDSKLIRFLAAKIDRRWLFAFEGRGLLQRCGVFRFLNGARE